MGTQLIDTSFDIRVTFNLGIWGNMLKCKTEMAGSIAVT